MKILVGTLCCGENEFERCVRSIRQQTHTDWEHFVISNEPNKKAHDLLYSRFMERSVDFDLFVKIDADMVLERETFFDEVILWMSRNPQIDDLQVAVHDWFSDRLIAGLHTFRNHVRWQNRSENVFVDDWPVPPDRRFTDYKELAPAAIHCPDPSPLQSFHFGIHKGVKVEGASGSKGKREHAFAFHLENIERTFQHYLVTREAKLALASLGAELAIEGEFTHEHLDYGHAQVADRLAGLVQQDADSMHHDLIHVRARSSLSERVRAKIIRKAARQKKIRSAIANAKRIIHPE